MASIAPKVRLVRCPKCFKILPELPNLPVYQCGGCGITLKSAAKRKKEDQEGESSERVAKNSAAKLEGGHDFEEKQLSISSQKKVMSITDGCRHTENHRGHDFKKNSTSRGIDSGVTSPDELNLQKKEASLSVSRKSKKADADYDMGADTEIPSPDKQKLFGGSNLSSGIRKPSVGSVPLNINASSLSEDLDMSEKIVRRYANLIGAKSPVRTPEATNDGIFSTDHMVDNKLKAQLGASKHLTGKSFHADDRIPSSNDGLGDQVSHLQSRQSKASVSGSETPSELITDNGEQVKVDISVSSMTGTKQDAQNQAKKLSSPFAVRSGSLDQDELPKSTSIIQVDPIVVKKFELSEPPSAKSNHDYSHSTSSDDELVDQVSDIRSHQSKSSYFETQKVVKFIGASGRTLTDEEVQDQTRNLSLMSVNEKHDTVGSASIGQDKFRISTSILSENDMMENKLIDGLGQSPLASKGDHAYDDSVSSSDGCDDQVSQLHSHLSKRSFLKSRRVVELISTHDGPTREDNPENSSTGTKVDMQNQAKSEKYVPVFKGSASLDPDKLAEFTSMISEEEDDMVESNLRGRLRGSKVPAPQSSHAYDGSVSSNDGCGDQASDLHSHHSKGSFSGSQKVEELTGRAIKEDIPVDNRIGTKSQVQNQARKITLMAVNEKHGPVIVGSVSMDPDDLPENTRYSIQVQDRANIHSATGYNPVQSWLGLERGLETNKLSGQRGYENNGISNYRQDALMSSSVYIPKKYDSVERNQIELMRKVDELREQLNLSYTQGRTANERFRTKSSQQERQCPLRSPGPYRSMPFPVSGHANYPCTAYPAHVSYTSYSPSTSTPMMRSRELHTERDLDMGKLHQREKRQQNQSVKRHCRPLAGAAPFITCYNCQKVLYLHADSLLSSKRFHRLQCGSCSKVLIFSFRDGTHITRKSPTSRVNVNQRENRSSYSEDIGLSICKSVSSEGEQPLGKLVNEEIKKGSVPKKSGLPKAPGSPLHRLMGYPSPSVILNRLDTLPHR